MAKKRKKEIVDDLTPPLILGSGAIGASILGGAFYLELKRRKK